MIRTVKLPSGAELTVQPAPFADSKALYQAALDELKAMKLDPSDEVGVNLYKDLFCIGFSSKKIELALNECLKRCLYNGSKITAETWEPVEARQDYWQTCIEVAKENIDPFAKSLLSEYGHVLAMLQTDLTSRQTTTI
jgi:hypothetical protein